MLFIVYARYGHDRRSRRVCITRSSTSADRAACHAASHPESTFVKIVCHDGDLKETHIYKGKGEESAAGGA